MTHHDKARELVERLKQWDGCWPASVLERDVLAAADLITAQAEENRRLREALQRIEAASKFWSEYPDGNDAIRYAHESTHRLALAALSSTGENG